MNYNRSSIIAVVCASLLIVASGAKTRDPYKVLGVERNASQREIQKAFHKMSLQYHPDKNKNKGAQEKFAEINNAYDILSDEEKRKNFDLYGDEKGTPGFDSGNSGSQGGNTYFTNGQGGFSDMGGHGSSKSFSFSFGGPGDQSSFGSGLNDIFSSFFGGMGGADPFESFSGAKGRGSRPTGARKSIQAINSNVYKKEILDKRMTWLLLSYTPTLKDAQHYESIIGDVAKPLQGAMKVGRINCETELSFCKEIGVYSRRAPRIFVYSFRTSFTGSLVEYNGDVTVKDLKAFCQELLPWYSKRIDASHFLVSSGTGEALPKVMLLSTKRDTPIIWRVLSGLYKNRFAFYDAEVHDVSDPKVGRWGVDALPAIVGWLPNGQTHILKSGIKVKDVKSSVEELGVLLDSFEKKNKKASSSRSNEAGSESGYKQIPVLTGSNFDTLCGESTPVCIFGVFRSSKGRDKIQAALSSVSQKSLSRQRGSKDSISYAFVDASQHPTFLKAFDKSGFKSSDNFLIAYKPRKEKFAVSIGKLTAEGAESFISSVLNGDVQFSKMRQNPASK